jgi:2-polyprenyl-6-methoxyphenol hydroxylase-like FAD-dependent oxidoreductase
MVVVSQRQPKRDRGEPRSSSAPGSAGWRPLLPCAVPAGTSVSLKRRTSPRELGFALLLAPNAMLALRAFGLDAAVASGGTIAGAGEIRRANGDVLRRLDAAKISAALGAPTVCVLRPVLHGLLLETVGDDALALGSEVVGCRDLDDRVAVTLADGRTAEGDVLVGADGVGSTIRRLLHPAERPPRASGLFALRGVAF